MPSKMLLLQYSYTTYSETNKSLKYQSRPTCISLSDGGLHCVHGCDTFTAVMVVARRRMFVPEVPVLLHVLVSSFVIRDDGSSQMLMLLTKVWLGLYVIHYHAYIRRKSIVRKTLKVSLMIIN